MFEHLGELAELETLDNGKPISVTRAVDAPLTGELFQDMAGWANKLEGNTTAVGALHARRDVPRLHAARLVGGQIIPARFPRC